MHRLRRPASAGLVAEIVTAGRLQKAARQHFFTELATGWHEVTARSGV
jgi:hypothetical protein